MQGFYIGSRNQCLGKVAKKTEELTLLARGDGTDIMLQKIEADKLLTVDPGDNEDLLEFFYILEGSISYEEGDLSIIIDKGDYFHVHNLGNTVFLKTITDVTILYISSQPVFHLLSNEINQLTEMAKSVEKKDMHTNDHNNRLGDYACKVAKKLGLSDTQTERLYYASVFHDIGKIYVPDEILKKPDKLTNEEFQVIKKHPSDGRDIVSKTFLGEIGNIIEQHHERTDGSGYPLGLKEDEICIEAKIIAVIDSYDAMTTNRPYRKALDVKVSLEEIRSLIGKQYDEEVVNTFEKVLQEEGII